MTAKHATILTSLFHAMSPTDRLRFLNNEMVRIASETLSLKDSRASDRSAQIQDDLMCEVIERATATWQDMPVEDGSLCAAFWAAQHWDLVAGGKRTTQILRGDQSDRWWEDSTTGAFPKARRLLVTVIIHQWLSTPYFDAVQGIAAFVLALPYIPGTSERSGRTRDLVAQVIGEYPENQQSLSGEPLAQRMLSGIDILSRSATRNQDTVSHERADVLFHRAHTLCSREQLLAFAKLGTSSIFPLVSGGWADGALTWLFAAIVPSLTRTRTLATECRNLFAGEFGGEFRYRCCTDENIRPDSAILTWSDFVSFELTIHSNRDLKSSIWPKKGVLGALSALVKRHHAQGGWLMGRATIRFVSYSTREAVETFSATFDLATGNTISYQYDR